MKTKLFIRLFADVKKGSRKQTGAGNRASIRVVNAILLLLSILVAFTAGEIILRAAVHFKFLSGDRGFASLILQQDTRRIYLKDASAGNDLGLFRETPNSKLRWEPVPGAQAQNIRINAGGFRGPDVYFLPARGITRVAILGDSQAFGMNLAESDTLAGALERKLNTISRKEKFEVLNFGVPGYNTEQEMLVFRQKVWAYHPSVIVLYYSLNDPEIPDNTVFLGNGLLSSSYLYTLAVYSFKAFSSMNDLRRASENLAGYYRRLYSSAYFQRCADLIREMAAQSESRGARFYLIIAPEVREGFEHFADYPYGPIHEYLHDLASPSLRVIDPLPAFQQVYDSPQSVWVTGYDTHLNTAATRLVADSAARQILSSLPQNF